MPSYRFKTTMLAWMVMPVLLLAGSPSLDELVKNSPFGNAPAPGAAGAQADAQLEFRGVLVDGGETFFSLYDVSTRSSLWVGLNEAGNPFVVESYDEAKGAVTVNFRGRVLTVALKQARVVAMPAAPMPMPAPAPGTPPAVVAGAPGAVNAVPADEAARLSQIAEEIRRRRALRAQMMQQNANAPVAVPAPPSNSPPQPQNSPRP